MLDRDQGRWAGGLLATLALAVALPGCGGGPATSGAPRAAKGAEQAAVGTSQALSQLLASVSSAPGQTEFAALFADPAAVPKDRAFYQKHILSLEGIPAAAGDTLATAVGFSEKNGTERGSAQWTFVQKDGKWLIAAAPMPGKPAPVSYGEDR